MSLFSGMSADKSADASADALCIIIQPKPTKRNGPNAQGIDKSWKIRPLFLHRL